MNGETKRVSEEMNKWMDQCINELTGFPLFRTDKIPWLFQYFLPFFQYFLNVLFFLTENLIHFTKKMHSSFKYH